MEVIKAIIMGLVQGLTEFLPISSSGHIVLTSHLFEIFTGAKAFVDMNEEILLDIMLHFGTLVAILVYFKNDIKAIFNEFITAVKTKAFQAEGARIPIYIFFGTFATGIIALTFKDSFELLLNKPQYVGIVLILTGFLLVSTEKLSERFSKKKNLNIKNSLIIGISQGLAVAPGLSRSGSTIAAGIATGLDRVKAARYSFLLSIPIILLATMMHLFEIGSFEKLLSYNLPAILVGTLTAGVSGYFCIKYFIQYITRHKLNAFAYYCFIVGAVMAVFFSVI